MDGLVGLKGIQASVRPDRQGLPFSRIRVDFERGSDVAKAVSAAMRRSEPAVWVMEHGLEAGYIQLELVQLEEVEIDAVALALAQALRQSNMPR